MTRPALAILLALAVPGCDTTFAACAKACAPQAMLSATLTEGKCTCQTAQSDGGR